MAKETPEQREERRRKNRPLALRLICARERAGFASRAAFARAVKVEPNTVYRIERGDVTPNIETLADWAKASGTTTDELLGLTSTSREDALADVNGGAS